MYSASKSPKQWIASLNSELDVPAVDRRTSIICTIGPKSNNVETMCKLRDAGMNIVRMNFSHGSYEYHQSVIDNARKASATNPLFPLAIALDTKGPEIRTGFTIDGQDFPVSTGHEMIFTTDDAYAEKSDNKVMYVDYKNITKVIEVGRTIYVDDGILSFTVIEKIDDNNLKVRTNNNGKISSKKGVNLPKTDVDLPALSEKDKSDLRFGVKNGVDMIFASFIRRAQDVHNIREVLGEEGKNIKILCKIENQQGVNNYDEILEATDGIMVARGDLGIEIPASQVFVAQKMMIAKANIAGKPIACATQMLESMTYNPRPTRAEVSDVGNAVLDGADLVMLSGETAKGSYPVEAVTYMAETARASEASIPYGNLYQEMFSLARKPVSSPTETTAVAAIGASIESDAKAIIVLSVTGTTARLCSKYRPSIPIIMVTRDAQRARQSHLNRGVYPAIYEQPALSDWQQDVDARVAFGCEQGYKMGILKKNDNVIVLQGAVGGKGHTSIFRLTKAE
ncbi:pyruvate kinase [Schizosaccharomyces cryophilus OY26]|uniref:Pyruvate kinase n=1 Tax=Schizosaccharomyces cryophilus (strain OY26 / ATCC MYA-4695 / CBS 11777 / NBRC 106824 / NRRL Y48691) TaxID=653667 RepID=S9VZC6_SCHCR|nr:pyruvate kinase [Schizosaccharomyces cryophilus OY26]EPY51544.1 pyruvate kinase [Schizosaccharomyces cryophilus OY26]